MLYEYTVLINYKELCCVQSIFVRKYFYKNKDQIFNQDNCNKLHDNVHKKKRNFKDSRMRYVCFINKLLQFINTFIVNYKISDN